MIANAYVLAAGKWNTTAFPEKPFSDHIILREKVLHTKPG
jgi:hypothetical protein